MEKRIILFETEYVSQKEDFTRLPYGYINKTVCGCGATSVALENEEDAIIAVPTIALVMNKAEQYPKDRCRWQVLGVYGDTEKEQINAYIARCGKKEQPIKVMVCYDSLWKVENLLNRCRLIIDESDQIVHGIKLKVQDKGKGRKDMDVYSYMMEVAEKHKDKLTFISATPTPIEYLPRWVSEIPQIKFEFSTTVTVRPMLMKRQYPFKALQEEIIRPLEKDGRICIGDKTVTKVIIFLNSVQNINKIAKECMLKAEDVAVLCADCVQNDYKIQGFKRLEDPERLPKYTFITSSGFQGIDLYDKEAINVVVSNTSQNHQMVNLLTDLKQATSRQRRKDNPNYDRFIYIYNQNSFEKTEEQLLEIIEAERKQVCSNCETLNEELASYDPKYADNLKTFQDSSLFNQYTLFKNSIWQINELAFNADRQFILETRRQYEKGFDIAAALPTAPIEIPAPKKENPFSYKTLLAKYRKSLTNPEITFTEEEQAQENYQVIHLYYRQFHNFTESPTYAKQKIAAPDDWSRTLLDVRKRLKTGKYRWTKELKPTLAQIYKQYNVSRTPKTKDLYDFGIKFSKTKVNGYEYIVIESI